MPISAARGEADSRPGFRRNLHMRTPAEPSVPDGRLLLSMSHAARYRIEDSRTGINECCEEAESEDVLEIVSEHI